MSPFDLVFFGGTGDLVMRKLLPALYDAHVAQLLHPEGRIIGLGRRELGKEGYLKWVEERAKPHLGALDEATWQAFCQRLDYLAVDANNPLQFQHLAQHLGAASGKERALVIYLSTAPQYFMPICQHLAQVDLNRPQTRLVLEKPLGEDLASAQAINQAVTRYFAEHQVYRIDHYLGKEPVQNLLALRFANRFFEPLWCAKGISAVEITISEELGVEGRGQFYEQTGALRDMVQNHLLQLLCFIAMEQPASLAADDIRQAKLAVLQALKPWQTESLAKHVIRGQYTAGEINNQPVVGYREEADVAADSHTETFVAMRVEIENARWQDVPFLLRTGKRLGGRLAQIVVHFHQEDKPLFPQAHRPNRLSIRLQPQESVKLFLQMKAPGARLGLQEAVLDLDLLKEFPERRASAYERLLLDAIEGNLALFMHSEELEAAWDWLQPLLDDWQQSQEPPLPYAAGSHGPDEADRLSEEAQMAWYGMAARKSLL